VALLSGGLDSTTMLWWLAHQGWAVEALTIAYGQRHQHEVACAESVARQAPIFAHHMAELPGLAPLMPGSPLTDAALALPAGYETGLTARMTYVPVRNATFLSIAYGYALGRGYDAVALAVFDGDAEDEESGILGSLYPDCTTAFLRAFVRMGRAASHRMHPCGPDHTVGVLAPWLDLDKTDVVRIGTALGVPYHLTRSCWEATEQACGRCATCHARWRAFAENELSDPVPYTQTPVMSVGAAVSKAG
jgi:7-cyano-7-deazaguanine synthase